MNQFIVITKNNRARIMSAAFFKRHGMRGWMQTHSVTLKNDRHEFTRTPASYASLKPLVERYNAAATAYFASKDYSAHVKAYRASLKVSAA